MTKNVATLIGLSAILLWSLMAGLIKKVSMLLGADLGITLVYSCSALLVLLIFKLPNLRKISKKYLFWGTLLFCGYELSFAFAIAYAENAQQSIEVNIIHYLWPSLMVMAFILVQELKFSIWVIFGLLLSIIGIIYIQTGESGLDLNQVIENFKSNPISYILALAAAIIWSIYCVITKKMSEGNNPISIFFIFTAIILWIKFLWVEELLVPSLNLITTLYIVSAGLAVGLGYAAWNIGIMRGNITILVAATYCSPILSSLSAMLILQTDLSVSFWKGTCMVIVGSFICWIATNWNLIKRASI